MGLPTGIRRIALIVAAAPLTAAMTAVMLASPSAAATQSAGVAVLHQAAAGHTYRTLVTGLRIRKAPHTSAPVVHVLGAAGSRVTVDCYAYGSSVAGDPVWYHTVAPRAGFAAGYYLNTGRDPAAGIPACAIRRVYRTLVTGLRIRKAPHTSAPVVHVLGAAGSRVTVNCFAYGSSVAGDPVWYHTVAPRAGFAAGYYLNTGRDPAAGIPHC
jgi:hypothetical protein